MAPTITTGFLHLLVSCRKYAVSSIVSVPCVITKPSYLPQSALIVLASFSQTSSDMSWLPMFVTCTGVTFATFASSGTAATRWFTDTLPASYAEPVELAPAPAIVPPVASTAMFGSARAAPEAAVRASVRRVLRIMVMRLLLLKFLRMSSGAVRRLGPADLGFMPGPERLTGV